jgi:UDPglucose--hexose-1-phosphate uridylyltransferase
MAERIPQKSDGKDKRSESFGPIALTRHLKDDGRALIVYERIRGEDEPAEGSADTTDRSGARGAHSPQDRVNPEDRIPEGWVGRRCDELRGERVSYAIDRQERTFLPPAEHCPLCPTVPGGEPTEIPFAAFEIAVFENRFPAFRAPHGAAEVVVYTDAHTGSLGTLSAERVQALMWVWRHRYAELGAREDVEYVLVFENRGVEVGVTLHHPHGQIYAYPFLAPVPALELAADARLGGCAPCELLARELKDGRRVVYENEGVVVYVPYAARWAYEAHVVVRAHRPSLLECAPGELDALADGLQTLVRGYDALFERPFPYVMAVHQAPTGEGSLGDGGGGGDGGGAAEGGGGHLHVEFYPPLRTPDKLKYLAGSEQGAGAFISDTLPEESAAALRRAIADGAA